MDIQIKINSDVDIPSTPNFIYVRTRREIIHGYSCVDICYFTDDELAEIGKKWTENLIKKAAHKRAIESRGKKKK